MQHRYVYLASGLALVAAAGLIADKTKQQRKYLLPDHVNSEGRTTLPNGWRITPAGRHIKLPGDLPMKMIVMADGKLLVNTAGWHDHDVNVIDMQTEKLEQSLDVGKNWEGMSFEPATGSVFISTGGTPKPAFDEAVANLKHKIPAEAMAAFLKPVMKLNYAAGRLTFAKPVSIDGVSPDNYFISGVTAKAGVLYVLEINANRIYRLSDKSYTKQRSAETGNRPYAAELSPDGRTLAVSNWGGESVSLIDPETLKEQARINTGSHPNEMTWDRAGRLFVANSGSNSVSVIENGKVTETIKTSLDPKALVGSTPDAVVISHDGKRMYVANADNNDVAVINIAEKGDSKTLGFIPTGWYPTALAISPDDRKLFVGTAKGLGFHANYPMVTDYPRPFPNPKQPYDYIGGVLSGAVSVVDVPDARGLAAYTKQVLANFPCRSRKWTRLWRRASSAMSFPKSST